MNDKSDADVIEFIRLPEVKRITGLSSATIYRLASCAELPKQVKISAQTVGWVKSEVLAESLAKVKESREWETGSDAYPHSKRHHQDRK